MFVEPAKIVPCRCIVWDLFNVPECVAERGHKKR